MNVIRKKNEPSFFIARTRFCFYCANSRKKKKLLFTARTRKWSYGGKPEKKNSFYCTNSCVLIARTRPKKEKNFFLLHELVPSLIDREQEKKKVFLLHELVQKFVRNNYHIYVRKKNWHFVLCGKKKFILLQEFNETASCSYCANSIFFFKLHELYPKLVKFILSTSITDIKKKKPFWLCQQSKQNWLYCTN